MKKINLLEQLNEIDDRIIEKSISIDDQVKLKENKMKDKKDSRKKFLIIASTCASLCCIALIGIFVFNNKEQNERVQIANPLTEVKSVVEMEKYLGYDVPLLTSKKVKAYVVIGDSKYANYGRIIYSDDCVFNISKTNEDVSGVNGSTFESKESISNIKVSFYTFDEIKYGVWTSNGYSYSYSSSINDNNIKSDIKNIIDNK